MVHLNLCRQAGCCTICLNEIFPAREHFGETRSSCFHVESVLAAKRPIYLLKRELKCKMRVRVCWGAILMFAIASAKQNSSQWSNRPLLGMSSLVLWKCVMAFAKMCIKLPLVESQPKHPQSSTLILSFISDDTHICTWCHTSIPVVDKSIFICIHTENILFTHSSYFNGDQRHTISR